MIVLYPNIYNTILRPTRLSESNMYHIILIQQQREMRV